MNLVPIKVLSCYKNSKKQFVPLGSIAGQCVPEFATAINGIITDCKALGCEVRFSDLFRNSSMQNQAHSDYVTGVKKSFSPPAGSSMHEAGRAMDVDLSSIKKIGLTKFWEICKSHGVVPIISKPDSSALEAWHFECRGEFQRIYDYVARYDSSSAYKLMTICAIADIGTELSDWDTRAIRIQTALILRGFNIGKLDGIIGPKCRELMIKSKIGG